MHIYGKIYDFAASAGSLEGFVYHKEEMSAETLRIWVDNLVRAYQQMPQDAISEFQPLLDGTMGRAIRSLIPLLGEDHEMVTRLRSMVKGRMPESADDFQMRKWFQE